MQRSLRSLLSVDVADITGLMSGKVKYYVGKLLVKLILLSMKLSGNLFIYCICSPQNLIFLPLFPWNKYHFPLFTKTPAHASYAPD